LTIKLNNYDKRDIDKRDIEALVTIFIFLSLVTIFIFSYYFYL